MNIKPEDYDNTCYIVGGGPSLKTFDWSLLDDPKLFVVAINSSHIKLPNCNLIYVTDPPYIQGNMETLKAHKAPVWQGALNPNNPKKLPVVDQQVHLQSANGLITNRGTYASAHGSNSVYAFLNTAVNLGFKKIYLLGVDLKWQKKGDTTTSHWHSDIHPHKRIDAETVYKKMQDAYKTIKKPLLDMGIQVINVNTPEGTDLKVFPILPVEKVFEKKI